MDNYSTSIDNENGRSCIRRAFRLEVPLRMEFYEEKGMTSPLVLVIRAGRLDVERKDRPGTGHGGAREGGMGKDVFKGWHWPEGVMPPAPGFLSTWSE